MLSAQSDVAQGMRAVLRNRHFVALWMAQIASQLSFNMLNFVLITRVFLQSDSSLAVSLLILAIGIPSVVFGLLAGVYVDRWNKKWVLVVTNLLRGSIVPFYLLYGDSLLWLYAVTFVISSITQFFAPAEASTIPAIVKRHDFVAANTLFLFTLYGAFIIGYSAAGPIQHLFGDDFPFFLGAGAYLLATILTLFLPSLQRKRKRAFLPGMVPAQQNAVRELREGLREIRADHRISTPIIFLTLAQTIIGVVIVLMPAFAERILQISVRDASYILVAPAGAGMIAGAVFMTRWSGRFNRFRLVGAGIVVAGLALAGIALSRGGQRLFEWGRGLEEIELIQGFLSLERIVSLLGVVGVMIFLLGFASSVVMVAAQTLLQENTAERIRGRVFGTLNMLVNVAATFPILLAGWLADLTSVVVVFFGLGVLVLGWGIFELARSRRRRKKRNRKKA